MGSWAFGKAVNEAINSRAIPTLTIFLLKNGRILTPGQGQVKNRGVDWGGRSI